MNRNCPLHANLVRDWCPISCLDLKCSLVCAHGGIRRTIVVYAVMSPKQRGDVRLHPHIRVFAHSGRCTMLPQAEPEEFMRHHRGALVSAQQPAAPIAAHARRAAPMHGVRVGWQVVTHSWDLHRKVRKSRQGQCQAAAAEAGPVRGRAVRVGCRPLNVRRVM